MALATMFTFTTSFMVDVFAFWWGDLFVVLAPLFIGTFSHSTKFDSPQAHLKGIILPLHSTKFTVFETPLPLL